MDEVDRIILSSLKEIDCEFDDDVKLLKHLNSENIIEGFARCLNLINPSLNIPTKLPPSMADKFKLGATIANACKDIGYKDEIGYQTFLYSNETEIRRIFTFVIEKLPKGKETTNEGGHLSKLHHDISQAVKASLGQEPVLSRKKPFLSVPLETGVSLPGIKREVSPQEWCKYCVEELPFLHEQTDVNFLLPSIITLNSRGFLSPSQLCKKIPLQTPQPTQRIEKQPQSMVQKHLEELRFFEETDSCQNFLSKSLEKINGEGGHVKDENEIISELETKLQDISNQTETLSKKLSQVNEEVQLNTEQYEKSVRENRVSLLLSQGDESYEKLTHLAEEANKKLVRLNEQWEQHQAPLLERLQKARSQIQAKSNFSNERTEALQETRNTLRTLLEQLKKKEVLQSKLEAECAALAKNPKPLRSAYTQRIMEIISNIRKQTNEINKIIADTKDLQRDVNSVTGRLERVFSVADDLIFQAAKKDEAARRSYKLLVALHSDCTDLVSLVQETGSIVREIKDLEEQIKIENAKNVSENLAKVLDDLRIIKEERARSSASRKKS